MLYSEIIAVCSQIHTEHKYLVWTELEFVSVKPDGTYGYHWVIHGSVFIAI
jgi:hypothetical protein